MKIWNFIAFLALLASVNSLSFERVAFEAFKALISEYFASELLKLNFIFQGQKSQDLAEKLIREASNITLELHKFGNSSKIAVELPSIFLFDDSSEFLKGLSRTRHFDSDGKYPNNIVYVRRKKEENFLTELFEEAEVPFENRNFINIVDESTVHLVTSFRFQAQNCDKIPYKTINRFSMTTMKWENRIFFPEKYKNFNGCPLTIAITDAQMYSKSNIIYDNLAQNLNFTVNRTMVSDLPSIKDRQFHLIEFLMFQNQKMYEWDYRFSPALFSDYATFTSPAGEPYTQLEKMFIMFDMETWICIVATLAGSWLVIQIINFTSLHVKKFVFGRDIASPSVNLVNIFLSGGQHKSPGRNFARFILMMFVIWSLIIRTCYQSELFKNLQSDMRKPRARTVEDLNERNFTIWYRESALGMFGENAINRWDAS